MPKKLNIAKRFSLQSNGETEVGYISTLAVSEQRKSVSEDSLKVWSELPVKIRQDPSMALFQTEHERLHGKSPTSEISDENPENENDRGDKHCNGHGSGYDEINKETEFASPSLTKNADSVHAQKKVSVASTQVVSEPEKYQKYVRMVSLLVIWFIVTSILASSGEKTTDGRQVVVPAVGVKEFTLRKSPATNQFKLTIKGAFVSPLETEGNETNYLEIQFQTIDRLNESFLMNVLHTWKVPTVPPDVYETSKLRTISRRFELSPVERGVLDESSKIIQLSISKRSNPETYDLFSMEIFYYPEVINAHIGALFGAMILVIMYVLVIWEVVHRTFASIISATMGIAVLAIFDDKPTMEEIIVWIDSDTLLLLFSMMTLVAVLTETGIFDYIAVLTFEVSNGKIWPLIHCLCCITCLVSAFLDNVTTVLLMTPITIKLCEVMKLDPVPILMAIVVHANVGGTMTPIGDPPNIIITNNNYIQNHGVTFITFVAHMVPGVILVVIQTSLHFRYIFRDIHNLRYYCY